MDGKCEMMDAAERYTRLILAVRVDVFPLWVESEWLGISFTHQLTWHPWIGIVSLRFYTFMEVVFKKHLDVIKFFWFDPHFSSVFTGTDQNRPLTWGVNAAVVLLGIQIIGADALFWIIPPHPVITLCSFTFVVMAVAWEFSQMCPQSKVRFSCLCHTCNFTDLAHGSLWHSFSLCMHTHAHTPSQSAFSAWSSGFFWLSHFGRLSPLRVTHFVFVWEPACLSFDWVNLSEPVLHGYLCKYHWAVFTH